MYTRSTGGCRPSTLLFAALGAMTIGLTPAVAQRGLDARDAGRSRTPTQSTPASTLHVNLNAVLGLTESTLLSVELDTTPTVPVLVTVPIEGVPYTLDLSPHSVRSSKYQVLEQQPGGALVPIAPGPIRTLRGTVVGMPDSRVAGSMLENGLHASIQLDPDTGRWWLEPASAIIDGAPADHYLLYHDTSTTSLGECGTGARGENPGDDQPPLQLVGGSTPGGAGGDVQLAGGGGGAQGGVAGGGQGETCFYNTELAIDTDYEYFLDYGNQAAVESQVNQIINTMNLQYETQLDITHEITALIVRPTPDDPYTDTGNHVQLLNQFRNYWLATQDSVPRDVAHLFTGRAIDGSVIGVAYGLGQICSSGAYCLSENIGGFSLRTDLAAHELGHLWDGAHCSCPSFTMNPSLTGANAFSAGTISSLLQHRDSRVCIVNECIPGNNVCEDAIDIGEETLAFTNIEATTTGPSQTTCGSGDTQVNSDVWYRYEAPCNGPVTVSLCGSGFDTRLAIYQAICPTGLNSAIACADDVCNDQSELTFDALGGFTYYVRIGGRLDAQGEGTVTVTGPGPCFPVPANDECAASQTISEGLTGFSTLHSTSSGTEAPPGCAGEILSDVWFRYFTRGCGGEVTFTVDNAAFGARLEVFGAACPDGPGEPLGCAEDDGSGSTSITVSSAADSVLRLRIGSGDGAAGNADLTVSCVAVCLGDIVGDTNRVDADDVLAVVNDWGCTGGSCLGDVTGNGLVDSDDILFVINNWGDCPAP